MSWSCWSGTGYTPVESLRAATSLPASLFGLDDRGAVAVGRRADLLLVDGEPTVDITATRAVLGVWIGRERIDGDVSTHRPTKHPT